MAAPRAMEDESRAVFVSVCGRVERVEVAELSLEGLCNAVSTRFDIGDRLRFTSDEEGEPEVASDEHLVDLAQKRHTLRVVISDSALSDLEQRMWQLRQLQWGFFQDELTRMKTGQASFRGETRQLRQMVEQSARREVELQAELLNERQMREKNEQAATQRHEALLVDLRREQRQQDAMEATLRKEIEDARQLALKFAAAGERQHLEVKGTLEEESQSRARSVEALLSEWAGSQAEVRQALEGVRGDIEESMQSHDQHNKSLLREASAREAFEQFFGDKIRNVEVGVGKLENNHGELEAKLQEAHDATRAEAAERAAGHQELKWHFDELRETHPRGPRSTSTAIIPTSSVSTMSTLSPCSPLPTINFQPGSVVLKGPPMLVTPCSPVASAVAAPPAFSAGSSGRRRSMTPPPASILQRPNTPPTPNVVFRSTTPPGQHHIQMQPPSPVGMAIVGHRGSIY